MARYKADFRLIAPSKKGGKYYFRDGSDPKRTRHSTGETTEARAMAFLDRLREERTLEPPGYLTFGTYSQGFFVEGCSYLLRMKQEGRLVNPKTIKDYQAYLRNYLVPAFGETLLTNITAPVVRSWRESVLNGSTAVNSMRHRKAQAPNPRTLNYVLGCLRIILGQAEEDGLLQKDPLARVKSLPTTKVSPHDALSEDEIRKLFGDPTRLRVIWGNTGNITLFVLLFSTGMRSGEVRALCWVDVDFERSGILLRWAVKADGTIGLPKNRKPRAVLLPSWVLAWLKVWARESGEPKADDLVFPGKNRRTPRSRAAILAVFKKALQRCGIVRSGASMKLVVHSSRHTWNTILVNRREGDLARSLLGHGSPVMTEHYYHSTLVQDLERLRVADGQKVESAWLQVVGQINSPSPLSELAETFDPV